MRIATLRDLDLAKKMGSESLFPPKTKIMVGMATCGIAAGAREVFEALREEVKKRKLDFIVSITGCNGLCYKEPLIDVLEPGKPRLTYGEVKSGMVPQLVESIAQSNIKKEWLIGKKSCEENIVDDAEHLYCAASPDGQYSGIPEQKELDFYKKQLRVVMRSCGLIDPCNLYEYIAAGGYKALYMALTHMEPEKVIEEVITSGLRGRGGAGFPTGLKWKLTRNNAGDVKYIICNADEGDPGAYMDRSVLEGDPYSVLEGMTVGAYAIGARKAYIYVRDEYPLAVKRLQIAIAQAERHGLIGQNIFNSGFDFTVKMEGGAHAALSRYTRPNGRPVPDVPPEAIEAAISLKENFSKLRTSLKDLPESDRSVGDVYNNASAAVENLTSFLEGKREDAQDFDFSVQINRGAGAFVCGEETALIASIEGRVGEPRPRPPFPAQQGVWGAPTNINNVETWANIPVIIARGGAWFAKIGTEKSRGTKVFSVVGKINRTGLIEVPMGITLREIIFDIGGGIAGKKSFKAVQTGGPSGGCIPEEHLDLPVDYEALAKVGAIMGSGGMIVMDDKTCMVDVARYFLSFLEDESCGKCTPCREGTKRMHEVLRSITEAKGEPGDIQLLQEMGAVIKSTSLCALGGTAPNPVLSTIRYFKEEYEKHIFDRKCSAGVCKELIKYSIAAEKCNGCTYCMRVCPAAAIKGAKKVVHSLDQSTCIKCGACYEVCKFDAVAIN